MRFAIALMALFIWGVLSFGRGMFWRVRFPGPSPAPAFWPEVTAIVPARNEAEGIAESLGSLLRQDYPGRFEIIVIDDHSNDGTADRALDTAARLGMEERVRVVLAQPLPEGWAGKVWAQAEGLRVSDEGGAAGGFVWLTDADIWHAPETLTTLVARAVHEQRVLTSLMVRLRCESLAERAFIPAFVFFFAKLYPFSWVNNPRKRTAAAAGGCMLVSRAALTDSGGLAAIRDALIDDCALARRLKKVGSIRLDFADASRSLRAYPDARSIWDMIARTAFTQLAYRPTLLLATVAAMGLTYLAPPFLTLTGSADVWPAAIAWLLMSYSFLPVLRYYARSPLWCVALPLIALFYLAATLESARRYWTGTGGRWKGRAQAARRS